MFSWKSYLKVPLLAIAFMALYATANGSCTARFAFVDTGLTVTFLDSSSADLVNKKWIFGDGDTSAIVSKGITHTYKAYGTYTVKLIGYDNFGTCSDTTTQIVKLTKNCAAQFSFKDNGFGQVKFTNLSQGFSPIYSRWKFGDGATSQAPHPNHAYSSSGTFTACLFTIDSNKCEDSVCKNITIGPQCDANFSFKLVGADPYIYEFTNKSKNVGNAKYSWDFGNDSTSTLEDPIVEFAKDGTYGVTLIVESTSKNCADTIIKPVVVKGTCEATFTAPSFVNNSLTVPFTSTSTGNRISHNWNFGDGNFSNSSNPIHVYSRQGIYDVELVILDTTGRCTDTARKTIRVTGLCTADFGYSFNKSTRRTTFTNLSSDTTAGNSYIRWYLGDGAYDFSGSNIISHAYKVAGSYTVSLDYTNQYGCSDSISKTVVIPNTDCVANFGYKDEGEYDLNVSFLDSSTGDSILTRWDFGDGNISNGIDPVHPYTDAGSYTVQLIATDAKNGCIDTLEKVVEVKTPDCDANFSVSISGFEAQITNLSKGYQPSYEWDFGDGSKVMDDSEPLHNYTKSGVYTIQLNLTDGIKRCQSNFSQKVSIVDTAQNCSANFSYEVDTMNPFRVKFSDLSTGKIKNHFWDFGDGQTSSDPNPTHTFKIPGNYQVSLRVQDSSEQCTDSLVQSIKIEEVPCDIRYEFVIDPREKYTVFVRIADLGRYSEVEWTFGDGDKTNERYPTKDYDNTGRYRLCLTINDPLCQSTYCDSFTIDELGDFSLKRGFRLIIFPEFVGAGGASQLAQIKANVYPNPFSQQLVVETDEALTQLSMKDFAGRDLPVHILEKGSQRVLLDTDNLPAGVYLLELETDDRKSILRIMKN